MRREPMNFFEDIVPTLQQRKLETLAIGIAAFSLVVLGDYLTPEALSFSVFYLVPVGVFVWFFSKREAWLVAVASALVWPMDHLMRSDFDYFRSLQFYWEVAARFGFYSVFIISSLTIRRYIDQLKVVNAELTSALAEVRQLKGLLPICASCKKIRDESDQWVVMEKYIQSRTDARFSHGLCPECMKKLYPEAYDKMMKERK
jgi:hypothetical protein